MLKKQIYTLIGLALVTTLIVVGAWALKSGKLAGWADTGPAEIDIYTKDTNGNAVGFVDILVSSDGQNYSPAGQTQSNGHLIYQDLAFQNHTLYLKASKPYHSTSPDYRQLSVSSGNRYNTDFTVTPIAQDSTKGKLKGKVTESGTNNPLNGAFIAVAKGTQVSNTGYSNVQGDYGVANIVPDTYTIISYRNGYQRKETPNITITANQETTLDITLSKESSPTPTLSESSSPSPSIQPDRNNFIFTAEVVDEGTQQLIKDVKVSIKINPAINGAVEVTDTTKENPIDASKYANNNLLSKVPYPSDCYSARTKYTVEFSHPAYETQTLPDFYCYDISFSDNLQTYFYNVGRIALIRDRTSLCGVVSNLDTKKPIRDVVVSLIQDNNITTIFAKTDKDGKYCLESDPGKFTVFAYHPAYYDNNRAVKEITLKKGKNVLNFELKFIVGSPRYDLYVRLLDPNGIPITLSDYVESNKKTFYLVDTLRSEIFYSDYASDILSEDGSDYLVFKNAPCGRTLRLIQLASFPYRGVNYRINSENTINYQCSSAINKYYIDIKFEQSTNAKDNNDPKKPDVDGVVNLKDETDDCSGYENFFYDKKNEKIQLILTEIDTEKESRTILNESGGFEFVDVEPGKYDLSIDSTSIQLSTGTGKISFVPDPIEVKDKDVEVFIFAEWKDESINKKFIEINGVKIYFIGPISQTYINKVPWEEHVNRYLDIKNLLKESIIPNPPLINIRVIDRKTLGAYYNRCGLITIESSYLPRSLDVNGTIIHEYGHHVHTMMEDNNLRLWGEMFTAAKRNLDQDCIFQAIRDSNFSQVFDGGGHPWDNNNEFFASFFVAYFQHHERLLALIRSLPEGSECRNILEFAWQFFSEKVAKTPGEAIDTASSASNSIRLYKNDDEIFGPVVGGKIGNNVYTPEQIAKGFWKQSVYDRLKPAQKASLRASLAYRRVLNYLKIDPEKYGNQIDINIVKFNSFIDKMLGTRGGRGSIEGVIKEQNGGPKIPKENIIVIIGKKMAVTDKDGKFKIENIKTGEQKVRIIDGKTSKNLKVDLETVNIQKDKTIKRYFTIN